jgi:alpha-N-acetylglucosaminidase
MKGNLATINQIPFSGMAPHPIDPGCPDCPRKESTVVGTGFTPEGIDQNPVYYEFVTELHWRTEPVDDITTHTIDRAHRRYNLPQYDNNVYTAWALLVDSAYAQDLSVQDSCGVPHFPGHSSQFERDNWHPTDTLCKTFTAWGHLLDAAEADATKGSPTKLADNAPFNYDLVNLGRELLAQLSTPVSLNFSSALYTTSATGPDATTLSTTGAIYVGLLRDVDALVGTDPAFLLGSWLAMARAFAANNTASNATDTELYTDCVAQGFEDAVKGCAHFYEWNARTQITTWNPTTKNATRIPGGPNDYASKHWSGLVGDYYGKRAELLLAMGLEAAAAGKPVNNAKKDQILATHAYDWTTATVKDVPYPLKPVGDAVKVSRAMHTKYSKYYATCMAGQ